MLFEFIQGVCNILNDNDIPYMISGSIAQNIYAVPRLTNDIDIVIELSANRIDDFVSYFPESYISKNTIIEEHKRSGMFNVIDFKTGFKVDFIFRRKTDYYNLAFSRRVRVKEFGTEVYLITVEDLIIAKLIWIQQLQSEKQMEDIKSLLLANNIDLSYVNNWCDKLQLNTFDLLKNE